MLCLGIYWLHCPSVIYTIYCIPAWYSLHNMRYGCSHIVSVTQDLINTCSVKVSKCNCRIVTMFPTAIFFYCDCVLQLWTAPWGGRTWTSKTEATQPGTGLFYHGHPRRAIYIQTGETGDHMSKWGVSGSLQAWAEVGVYTGSIQVN